MARGTWGGGTDIHPLKVRISGSMGLTNWQTGFHLRDQSLTPVDPQDAAEHVAEWVTESFRTLFANTDRFLGVDVVDMTTGEGGAVSFPNLVGSLSIDATTQLPAFMQLPVALKGELRRKYGQGRMLWPIRHESWSNFSELNGSGVAAYQGVIDALVSRYIGSFPTNTYRLINVHGVIQPREATPTSPARPEVPPSWYDVTTVRLSTRPSFLRSRKEGVGS